jgi:hypothetical protein
VCNITDAFIDICIELCLEPLAVLLPGDPATIRLVLAPVGFLLGSLIELARGEVKRPYEPPHRELDE